MWPENTLARQAKYDFADEIKYNFEGAALTGKLTNQKHTPGLLHSFFFIFFSTKNRKDFWRLC